MVQVEIRASDDHELFTTLLRIDTSFVMMPHAILKFIPGSEAQTHRSSASSFEAQITKPREAYLLRLLHDLDICHLSSSTT
jgi:hypothetical protein